MTPCISDRGAWPCVPKRATGEPQVARLVNSARPSSSRYHNIDYGCVGSRRRRQRHSVECGHNTAHTRRGKRSGGRDSTLTNEYALGSQYPGGTRTFQAARTPDAGQHAACILRTRVPCYPNESSGLCAFPTKPQIANLRGNVCPTFQDMATPPADYPDAIRSRVLRL